MFVANQHQGAAFAMYQAAVAKDDAPAKAAAIKSCHDALDEFLAVTEMQVAQQWLLAEAERKPGQTVQ